MSEVLLEIQGLTKMYGRQKLALDGLTLTINRGDVFGLIGPNGAGKTTTFRILATLMHQSRGSARLGEYDYAVKKNVVDIRKRIGYMPDSFGVYEDMTVEEYLEFFAAAYGIHGSRRNQLVTDVLELVDLTFKKKDLILNLSRGMQQRLGLARVLIHDPDLLILDEPASGLDPRARVEIRSLLVELQKMGKTILISSHILADLGEICNRIGILEQGKMKVQGTLEEMLAQVKPSPIVRIRVAGDAAAAAALLEALEFVESVHLERETLVVKVQTDFVEFWRLAAALADAGHQLTLLQPEARNLEHAFMELTDGVVS